MATRNIDAGSNSQRLNGGSGGNRFFNFNEGPDEPAIRRVYAAFEVPDPDENGAIDNEEAVPKESVQLECIDVAWFDSAQREGRPWAEIYVSAPLGVLELNSNLLPPLPQEFLPGQIAWFTLTVFPDSGAAVSQGRFYSNLFSDGYPVMVEFLGPREPGWAGKGPLGDGRWFRTSYAKDIVSDANLTMPALRDALDGANHNDGVAVYDVGQGACQAVVHGEALLPALYIDFGGGVLGNAKTFPADFRGFCFSMSPSIVLSHWDWDHWSSAYRHLAALKAKWITPEIPEKPIQQAFAAHLHSLGNLLIWTKAVPSSVKFGSVRVERCTGRTVNDSGLAVTVYPSPTRRKNVLLPGDANYRHIPSVLAGAAFTSLSMTHHGGRLHSKVIPKARRGGTVVCSVGAGNSYKHPFLETYSAHTAAGWQHTFQTGMTGPRPSHVYLPWDEKPSMFRGGCLKGSCSVVNYS